MSNHRATLDAVINAWKVDDVEAVLDHLHPDVVYHYHVGTPPLEGRNNVERFLLKFGKGQSDIRWRIIRAFEVGDTLMIEGIDEYTDPEGITVRMPYMGVMEFEDGKVRRWRDYFDYDVLKAAKAARSSAVWDNLVADLER
ncbi:nuclear transport factor 2 family protein [Kordiimonas sp.]|uniref:nuclear transport factor 2 family protein n=1 Tax=Kordiimonas sp. TaxID=1970157 RepID=UPI003A95007A